MTKERLIEWCNRDSKLPIIFAIKCEDGYHGAKCWSGGIRTLFKTGRKYPTAMDAIKYTMTL